MTTLSPERIHAIYTYALAMERASLTRENGRKCEIARDMAELCRAFLIADGLPAPVVAGTLDAWCAQHAARHVPPTRRLPFSRATVTVVEDSGDEEEGAHTPLEVML